MARTDRPVAQEGVINRWQRGVPVYETKVATPWFLFFGALFAVGTAIGVTRLLGNGLGPFTAMTDAYAWGVWKTFNVMALTALGSGALAVGLASWVLGRHHLHTVMRTALVTSFLFYATALVGLLTDVGRPWNFWNMALPWRWNTESQLWEVAFAMPIYCALFLLYENGPMVVEKLWDAKSDRIRNFVRTWHPRIRKTYPFVVAGAYIAPILHQSSLGGLMVLAGHKVHPLWQTDLLPLLYLVQALICGFGSVIVFVMSSCLVWRRPLDVKVLGELADLMSWTTIGWLVAAARGRRRARPPRRRVRDGSHTESCSWARRRPWRCRPSCCAARGCARRRGRSTRWRSSRASRASPTASSRRRSRTRRARARRTSRPSPRS